MKTYLLLGMALAMAVVGAAAESRVFALATAGGVDRVQAERLRSYLETHAGVGVRMAEPVDIPPGLSLEAIGLAAARTLRADEFGMVVLARPDTAQPQGVCLPHERFGVLNIARLEEGADADRAVRRAGQDGLRVMSMLLDMSPCPFPLCVLTGFEKTEDLDRMSGNYCPPCMDRFARLARAARLQPAEKALAPALAEPAPEPAPAD